jgi:Flp pilus assembly protein TadG
MTAARLRRATGQRGSMALELVVLAPVLVLVVWLLGVYALRLAVANGDVEAAARDAARSASIARTAAGAQAAAAASAATSLAGSGRVCRSLRVAAGTADFRPGGTVSVTVTCAIRLADLAPLALGGAKEVRQTYVAPVDPYLGVRT